MQLDRQKEENERAERQRREECNYQLSNPMCQRLLVSSTLTSIITSQMVVTSVVLTWVF